jgi:hypothetical protein
MSFPSRVANAECESPLRSQTCPVQVVNLAEAEAIDSDDAGHAWTFENSAHRFPHFGINVHVLQPGEPASKYHAEEAQEAFLVLQRGSPHRQ